MNYFNGRPGGKREGAGRPKKGDHKRATKITLDDATNEFIESKLAEGWKLATLLEHLIEKEMQHGEYRKMD